MKTLYQAAIISLLFILNGCQTIGDWFDSVGNHMPVVGQRCEHWQCFTESGQRASDEKIRQMNAARAQDKKPNNTTPMPVQNNAAPVQQMPPEYYQ